MDALMRVMGAKKREAAAARLKTQAKYLRRAEVETLLEEKEEEETQKKKEKQPQQQEQQEEEEEAEEEQSKRKKRRLETLQDRAAAKAEDADEPVLAWPDLRRRLRELAQPVTLFGEDLAQRMARLRRVEIAAAAKHEDELGAGHDIRNRFVGGGGGPRAQAEADEFERDAAEDDEQDADKLVYRFFKGMLQRWEKDLAARPEHVKRTAQGKIAVKTMKQCKDYIRPLFKLCKQRQVPPDILPNLVDIVKFCRQGEFVMANDAYIKLAIGNAAWPIGVTMVGIHERTGREKINSNKQAHVMNNESQRKYLTSVKRLMSYAQSISNVLPSKRVL
ncbi:unnamed protein product [Phytophthora fragariaefolia]|uniref:Pre-mRNA-splicing factor 18 n=1 Tax=Phytophthora fragariaefolia TaxID=1490495 RepID=A0A9W6XZE6_9STRA|nr:unnamed protein product [Phytophthora fragariaefolia]